MDKAVDSVGSYFRRERDIWFASFTPTPKMER